MKKRKGDWMQTATGRQFWPLDPRPEDVDLDDIAHALGNMCRYAGHCRRFYSVAEHCVLMSRAVAPEFRLWALLHDAAEAYIVDVPRPLKSQLPGYKKHERAVMYAITRHFGLSPQMPTAVKYADNAILADEMEQNMLAPPAPWNLPHPPLGIRLEYWSPVEARIEFKAAVKNELRLREAVRDAQAAINSYKPRDWIDFGEKPAETVYHGPLPNPHRAET